MKKSHKISTISTAALAAMMMTMSTLVPQVSVMAAETTAVETVQAQADGTTQAQDAAAQTSAAQTSVSDVLPTAGVTTLLLTAGTDSASFADVCDSNYTLYTATKSAGTEEVAREAEEKAAQEAAAKAAAEAAAAKAAQQAAAAKAAQKTATTTSYTTTSSYSGQKLNRTVGTVMGPTGKECYYNMNMSTVVSVLKRKGYSGNYWVRSDGVKMFGNYVMVAANYKLHPYGSIVQTSLGAAIVCDTGTFIYTYPTALDVAVSW